MRHGLILDFKDWGRCRGCQMEDFVTCFAGVSDPRQKNVRHNLHEILMIALCTMLCGGEDCSDMELFGDAKEPFLRQFLSLRHGVGALDRPGTRWPQTQAAMR